MAGTAGGLPFQQEPIVPAAKRKIFSITKALSEGQPSKRVGEEAGPQQQQTVARPQGTAELLALMRQQTTCDDDRWRVLDARDKVLLSKCL